MELLLHVQQPHGSRYRAIRLACSGNVSGEDCRQQLIALFGSSFYQQSWFIDGTDIRDLVPGCAPFTSGAALTAIPHKDRNNDIPSSESPLFGLRVVHGPDSQMLFPLTRGNWPIGRQAPILRIQDPALCPVEGTLSVQSTGIIYRTPHHNHYLQTGELFRLGSSICLIEPWDVSVPPFTDPEVVELDVPAPRSRTALVLTAVLPIVLGCLIAWFTKLWFILLMACASSLLMGLHALAQGKETGKFRALVSQAASHELETVKSFRGIEHIATGAGVLLGRGTRAVRLRGKHRDIPCLPVLSDAPWFLPLKALEKLDGLLPVPTQRMVLYQLIRHGKPVYILISDDVQQDYFHLIEPLTIFDHVQLISNDDLGTVRSGILICAARVPGLPDPLIQFVLRSENSHFTPSEQGWENLVFDGITHETYTSLLSPLAHEMKYSRSMQSAHAVTSQIPFFEGPTLQGEHQDNRTHLNRDVSMYIGYDLDSNRDITLGLSQHGPHFLCAGTTGSGKSQLLRTMLWSLALHNSPQRLSLILIDFKGGAGLGPLMHLPHTSFFISDLDTSTLLRSLKYLKADLTKREELFHALGVSSYEDYLAIRRAAGTPLEYPEMVLCIDEFRMLVDSFPDIMNEIIRIATVGRSLGYHLILATQRPQGAISQDIRANISTTLCLRVNSSQDSYNLLESDLAATLPASKPGRGFIKDSENMLIPFQAPLLTGPFYSPETASCSADFVLNDDGKKSVEQFIQMPDQELSRFNRQLHVDCPPSGYSPVLPELTPRYPQADGLENRDDFSLDLGDFEIPEYSYQGRFFWVPQDGPIMVAGNHTDRVSALMSTVAQAKHKTYSVVCFTASEQTAQELRRYFGVSGTVDTYSLKDIEFIRHVLADISQDFPKRTLLIIDGFDSVIESFIRYPQAESHLMEILQQSAHHQLLVMCTSLALPRGKWQSFFPHVILTASAVKADPLRGNSKIYPLTPQHLFSIEGTKLEGKGKSKVEAGIFCWSLSPNERSPQVSVCVDSLSSSKELLRWKQLPEICTESEVQARTVEGYRGLKIGLDRQGTVATIPQLRGGFMSISGPRGAGKTTCLKTIAALNRTYPMVYIPSGPDIGVEHVQEIIERFQGTEMRPVLLVDDLDRLNTDAQHLILTRKEYFEAVLVAYTPWPRWNSSPILSALTGTGTGIVLQPEGPHDLAFYPGQELPLDLKTRGRTPAGRAVIIDYYSCLPVQIAITGS